MSLDTGHLLQDSSPGQGCTGWNQVGGGRVTFSGGIESGETCQKGGLKPVEKTVGLETKSGLGTQINIVTGSSVRARNQLVEGSQDLSLQRLFKSYCPPVRLCVYLSLQVCLRGAIESLEDPDLIQ